MEHKLSETIILALLEDNTEAAEAQTMTGELPLHKAIEYKLSENLIPEATKIEGINGMLPLHSAIKAKLPERLFVLFWKHIKML
jgi:hypothetical protein